MLQLVDALGIVPPPFGGLPCGMHGAQRMSLLASPQTRLTTSELNCTIEQASELSNTSTNKESPLLCTRRNSPKQCTLKHGHGHFWRGGSSNERNIGIVIPVQRSI